MRMLKIPAFLALLAFTLTSPAFALKRKPAVTPPSPKAETEKSADELAEEMNELTILLNKSLPPVENGFSEDLKVSTNNSEPVELEDLPPAPKVDDAGSNL